jgi:TolB protein
LPPLKRTALSLLSGVFAAAGSAAAPAVGANPRLESTLEVMVVASGERSVVYRAYERFEAPNWSRDGKELIVNRAGRICRIPVAGGRLTPIDTGRVVRCNNDHVLSPDGKWIAISALDPPHGSRVYVVPLGGGVPRLITPTGPSYCHGWSPDGTTLAMCAERNGNFDVYTVPVAGGEERRLTTAPELDDGPDYAPDGNWIYFNSARTDRMQLWRMHPDGTGQEQLTHDRYNNWFPHPSPDGRELAFISFTADVPKEKHIPNQHVLLRLVPSDGSAPPRTLAQLFGGQGTMNVPSWSPDGTRIAFVSYRLGGN